jgi:hypothetical protein
MSLSCLPLRDILSGVVTEELYSELTRRGWCFIQLDDELQQFSAECMATVKQFLEEDESVKKKYSHGTHYGYFDNGSKEGIRVVTGQYLSQMNFPTTVEHSMISGAKLLDMIAHQMLDQCGKRLFGMENVSPVVGMIDIVNYLPSESTDRVNAHGDPGLLSLSLGSSSPGLSMLDHETNTWIPVPNDAAVLWCGSTAAELNPDMKIGWHKVNVEQNCSRMTLWYEICAKDQIPAKFEKEAPSVERGDAFTVQVKLLSGKLIPILSHKGDKGIHLKERLQELEGLAPDKMRLIFKSHLLANDSDLVELGIKDGDKVLMVLQLRGG